MESEPIEEPQVDPRDLPIREVARRGGQKTREKYGDDHFQKIGQRGGAATRDKLGSEHFAEIGHKGGKTTAATHGKAHYQSLGKKSGERTRALIERAKELERQDRELREKSDA